ncbi:NUDIX hydrolase [Polluticoccus soli]|uniref:NUDIX hydrolase n=1 Tax=Polluticoccus soli TaxID=3034150 RepID=UPI0023E0BB25|nr:NUDIX domain-containing protein [Flavipsychrobacter sp. JY13-12]
MDTTQKIYYNNKPLVLTNDAAAYVESEPEATSYKLYDGAFTGNFRMAIHHLDEAGTQGAIVEDRQTEKLWEELYKLYEPIDAGGGVVLNEDGHVLMIFRRGKWDLPKGKLDDGEDIADCALREVSEETGLKHLELKEKVCDTYHIYSQYGQNLLKHTTWFKMLGTSKDKLEPQEEENILEVKWIPEGELHQVIDKSYDAIRETLQQSGFRW